MSRRPFRAIIVVAGCAALLLSATSLVSPDFVISSISPPATRYTYRNRVSSFFKGTPMTGSRAHGSAGRRR